MNHRRLEGKKRKTNDKKKKELHSRNDHRTIDHSNQNSSAPAVILNRHEKKKKERQACGILFCSFKADFSLFLCLFFKSVLLTKAEQT